jgi:hypothetical protein
MSESVAGFVLTADFDNFFEFRPVLCGSFLIPIYKLRGF